MDSDVFERTLFATADCRLKRGVGMTGYRPILTTDRLVLLGERFWRDWLWGLCHLGGIAGAAIGFVQAGNLLSWSAALRLAAQILLALPLGYLIGYLALSLLLRLLFPSVVKFEEEFAHVVKNPNAKWVDRAKHYASETIEYPLPSIARIVVEQHLGAPTLLIDQGVARNVTFRGKPEHSSALSELAATFSDARNASKTNGAK
jgi:hypothetical protein